MRPLTPALALIALIALPLPGCGGPSRSLYAELPPDFSPPTVAEAAARNKGRSPDRAVDDGELEGEASWYGERHHGRLTANGEAFDMNAFTAAHRTLPFNTVVRVTEEDSRRSVIVRINDRGPGKRSRVIDLSRAAASDLGILRRGVAPVRLEILAWGDGQRFHHLHQR